MPFEILLKLVNRFNKTLESYALKKKQVDDVYYTAKRFLSEILEKSYKNQIVREELGKYLKTGSTLELRALLKIVNYDERELVQFNAMDLIDTVHHLTKKGN